MSTPQMSTPKVYNTATCNNCGLKIVAERPSIQDIVNNNYPINQAQKDYDAYFLNQHCVKCCKKLGLIVAYE